MNLNWFYKSPPNLSQKKVLHTYEFKYILGKNVIIFMNSKKIPPYLLLQLNSKKKEPYDARSKGQLSFGGFFSQVFFLLRWGNGLLTKGISLSTFFKFQLWDCIFLI